eukprot:scaffold1637_cov253-Pinguiococcus_pyrenoidosus.AAC.16
METTEHQHLVWEASTKTTSTATLRTCLRHPVPVRERCAMDASFAIEHVESLLGRLDEQLELTVEDGRPLIHRHAANPSPPRARGPRSVLPEVLAVHHDAPLRPPRIEVQVDVDVRSRFVPLPNVHRVPGAIFHEGGPYCQGVFLPRRWVIAKVAQVPGLPPALVLRPPRYPPIGEQHSRCTRKRQSKESSSALPGRHTDCGRTLPRCKCRAAAASSSLPFAFESASSAPKDLQPCHRPSRHSPVAFALRCPQL